MAKILIVDDSAFMRGSLKYIVENDGHHVVGMASNGEEAIERYKELKPDVVTLDILMQGMDGIQALKGLMEYDNKAAVIMVTSLTQKEVERQVQELGVSGFIKKPFNPQEITDEIRRVLVGRPARTA